jgi:hypothetical protein
MRSGSVIVREIIAQDSLQVPSVEYDNMIQTLSPDRSDQPFHVRVLPGTLPGCQDLLNLKRLHSVPKRGTVNSVSIANQIPRCVTVNECLDNLLAGPLGGRVLGDIEMQHLTSAVFQDDQDKEDSKRGRRDG